MLQEELPKRFKKALDRDGQLPLATGNQVVKALKELRPGAVELIDRLQKSVDAHFTAGEDGEILRQQADSVGLAFEIAMFDRGLLRSWSPPGTDVPFLQGMPHDEVALEDHLVIHDSERFGDWAPVGVNQVAWRAFTSGTKRLYVMNANRTSVENKLGVDLIYYNESRHSFVMVQYKKLTKDKVKDSAKISLGYRPDGNLTKEMKRMKEIDQICTGSSGDFRLHETPCWLKLCDPSQEVRDLAKLIPGMYFARQHFEDLQKICIGPRGGVRITYENSGRHVSNTLFARLVSGGWIGTRGTSSDLVRDVLRASLETGRSVTLAVENDEEAVQVPVVH
jgi:hypothetical protein